MSAINDKKSKLNLSAIFPEILVNLINDISSLVNLRPECFVTSLLCGISAMHHKNTELVIARNVGFKVTPNLFGAIITHPSMKATGISYDLMAVNPLRRLDKKHEAKFNEQIKQYNLDLREYNKLKKSENVEDKALLNNKYPLGKPERPLQNYRLTGSIKRDCIYRMGVDTDYGFLFTRNDHNISGLFKLTGTTVDDLVDIYDGGILGHILRASCVDYYGGKKMLVSLLGSIQNDVFAKHFEGYKESSRLWSRFIFCHQPFTSPVGSLEAFHDIRYVLNEFLSIYVYEDLDFLAETPFQFSLAEDAKTIYATAADRYGELRINESRSAMRYAYSKGAGRIGKIAINLHILNYVIQQWVNDKPPLDVPLYIDAKTIASAVMLTDFYFNELEELYLLNEDDKRENDNQMAHIQRLHS